jgi:hypothetical protein
MNQPKGYRLNWAALKDVKPLKLTPKMLKGKALSNKDLEKRRGANSPKFLVP